MKPLNEEANTSLMQKPSVNDNASPTFCVAMLKNGSTVKIEGKVEEFLQTVKDADFCWINIRVLNLEEDGTKIAKMLGFNPAIIDDLIKHRFSGYEDQNTEV